MSLFPLLQAAVYNAEYSAAWAQLGAGIGAGIAVIGAGIGIGRLAGQDSVGVALVPNRLNRHTFWCGQSGSGKTYALGVLLERILLTTRLPMVVFDPNSDFVRLHEQATEAEKAAFNANRR